MNNEHDDESMQSKESQLMESLLQHALSEKTTLDEKMLELSKCMQAEHDARPKPNQHGSYRRGWISLAIAASVLLVAGLTLPLAFRKSVYAAVERSLIAEKQPRDRKYEVAIIEKSDGNANSTFTVDVYIRQDKIVAHTRPDHEFGELWIYRFGDERWIISSDGAEQVLLPGMDLVPGSPPIGSAPLVISTILEELREGYDLEPLSYERLTSLESATDTTACEHVVGTRRSTTSNAYPIRVEFWASQEDGTVQRLQIEFKDSDPSPVKGLTAAIARTPVLPTNFFDNKLRQDWSDPSRQ